MDDIIIRPFVSEQAAALAELFYDSVHQATAEYYNAAQRQAWAAEVPETARWQERLKAQHTFVATCNDSLAGFMTLRDVGYIDLAFVAPEFIGKGIGKRLYDRIEDEARLLGVQKLHSEASHLARRFFKRQGWIVTKEQNIQRGDILLTNFVMEKLLV